MSKKLLKTSLLFTALSTLASAINFAFYPVISHLLSVSEFGDVQLGVSFIMLAATLLSSLSTLALFTTANRESERTTLASIERLVISVSITGAALTALFATPIASLLQLQDSSLVYILASIFVLNIPAATWVGTLQGGGQFLASGWISVGASLTKLVAAYLFITMGFGPHGALLGIALGSFVMLPLVKLLDKSSNVRYSETFGLFRASDITFFRKRTDLLIILVSLILLALIANVDIIVAKAILDPAHAGAYAQISTVAKIPYFAGLPVALVLFERYIKKDISFNRSFLGYAGIVGIAGAGVVILSQLLLRTIFNYQGEGVELLLPLVASFTAYSILILLSYQLIARKRTKALLALSLISLFGVFMAVAGASTSSSIAYSYLLSILTALLLSGIVTYTKVHE